MAHPRIVLLDSAQCGGQAAVPATVNPLMPLTQWFDLERRLPCHIRLGSVPLPRCTLRFHELLRELASKRQFFNTAPRMNSRAPASDWRRLIPCLAVLLLASVVLNPDARADYRSTVLSQGPAGYWSLDETNLPPPQPILATNLGSLGESVDGGLYNGVVRGGPGLLAGTGLPSDRFTNSDWLVKTIGGYVNVPYTNAFNPNGPFTIEFWANPASAPPTSPTDVPGDSVFSPVCSLDTSKGMNSRMGYVFYIDGASGGWQWRIGNINGYLAVAKGGTYTPGGWSHVAGVSDGSSLQLYVDGQSVALTNFNASDYMPNTNVPFRVGMTTFPNRPFNGWIAEVAFYPTNLDGDTIKAHFDAATTNALGYGAQILAAGPSGYWRLDEPPDPVALNSGTLGEAANGSYISDAGPGLPGARPPDYPGFDPLNNAVTFDGGGGYVQLPGFNLNTNTVTITGWVKAGGPQVAEAGLILNRGSSAAGLVMDAGGGLGLAYNWNDDPATYNWASGLFLPDSDWAFAALVVQPTQAALYVADATNVSSFAGATNFLAHASAPFDGLTLFGGDPLVNNRYFVGALDEVAVFNRALGMGEVFSQYAAAIGGVGPQIFGGPRAPTNQLFIGDTFTLTIDAGGTPSLSYQWRKDGLALVTATSSTFTATNVDTPDNGNYDVVISNGFGSITSSPVAITIIDLALPVISQGPLSRTLYPGGSLALSVTASGGTLEYQWQKDGNPISGATNSTFFVASVGPPDSGSYLVVVSNTLGSATSLPATVTVVSPSPGSFEAAVINDGPEAWWRLDEAPGATLMADAMGRHDGTYTTNVILGEPGATQSSASTAAHFGGSAYGTVPFSPALNSPSFTFECWAKTTNLAEVLCPASTHYLEKGCYFATGVPAAGQWSSAYGFNGSDYLVLSSTAAATMGSNVWSHLVVTVDSGTLLRFYVNGQWDHTAYLDIAQNSGGPLLVGARGVSSTVAADLFWKGEVDEVVVYTNALSLAQVQAHYAAALYGTNTTPFFKLQPQPAIAEVGRTLTLQVAVEGSLPISLQWLKDNTPIPDETNATLTLTNLAYSNAGLYQLIATNQAGSSNSEPALLTVMPPPSFANLTNGLVLHLTFDGDTRDSSGLGHDGQTNGVPMFIPGLVGSNAILLSTLQASNSYNYVSVPLSPDLAFGVTDSFSVSFWINYTNAPDDLPMIGNAVGSTFQEGWVFADLSGQLEWTLVGVDNTSVIANPVGGPRINDGTWHNVVGSFDRYLGLANTYIDGLLVNSHSLEGLGSVDTAQPLALGQDPTGLYKVDGTFGIDDVGIWRRALDPYDAQAIYHLGINTQSFDTYGPVTLLQLPVEGGFQLIWQAGTLLQSDSIDGQWVPVPGAPPPIYMVQPGQGNQFYRVQL